VGIVIGMAPDISAVAAPGQRRYQGLRVARSEGFEPQPSDPYRSTRDRPTAPNMSGPADRCFNRGQPYAVLRTVVRPNPASADRPRLLPYQVNRGRLRSCCTPLL